MRETMGPDWRASFDMVIANAKKPIFFKALHAFYEIDHEKSPKFHRGNVLKDATSLNEYYQDRMILEGNASLLTDFFRCKLEKLDVKVAYFGDNYLKDIYAAWEFDQDLVNLESLARWDAILLAD